MGRRDFRETGYGSSTNLTENGIEMDREIEIDRKRRKHGCVHFLGLINGLVRRVNEERVTEGCMAGYGFSVFPSDSIGYALFENNCLLFCFPFALLEPSFKFLGFIVLLQNFLVFASHSSSESPSFSASFTTSKSENSSPKPSMLQISEWMNQKGICIFSPVDHAVQLDLIGKGKFCTNCCEIKPV
ncbi:hypothetical protein DVH24_029850 [Malus domestica]|uniref:Uncharacterized protein n=1 Tax=Malus domestica TaxID=3750 RepID=A0A498HWX1_MALDO|nr:hypothetical protein DVH24_029850 [Malus domestica]